MKKLTSLLLIGCVTLFIFPLRAEKVTCEKAEKVAKSYAASTPKLKSRKMIKLTHTVNKEVHRQKQTLKSSDNREEAMYYVFGMDDNQGFIIVSADDVAVPVLGYSENGTYSEDNPNFNYWMNCLAQEIAYAIENNIPQDKTTKAQWDAYIAGNVPVLRSTTAVSPILMTKWNQTSPYSDLCPNKVYTGCVATAMAQIMKHYNHPTTRTVTIPAYTTSTNGWSISAITGTTTYNWTSMTNTYSSSSTDPEKTAVATLMYHCGVSVAMDYTASGSGATITNAAFALMTYFNYDQGLQYKQREYYSDNDWEAMLRAEINAGRPVYYSGSNPSSGHAFVCDGYDDTGKFYFNWGWGGLHDGPFVTTALNPGTGGAGSGAGTYNQGQRILINIKPNSGGAKVYDIKISAQTNISASQTTLDRGESFTVNAPVRNAGLFNFTGNAGIAIVDAGDNILSVIGQKAINLDPGYSYVSPYAISCTVPVTAAPGNCTIKVVYKHSDDSHWSIATGSLGYTDALDLTITNNPPRTHGIKIINGSNLTSSASAVNRGEVFTVSAQYINRGTTTMTGDYGIALVDNSDMILEIIGKHSNTNIALPPGSYWMNPFVITCGIFPSIAPGNYKIRAVFRPTGENWSIIYGESTGVTDIVSITVNSAINPDGSNVLLAANFTVSSNPVNQFAPLNVQVRVFNTSSATTAFVGELELGLYNAAGVLQEVIGTENIVLPNNQTGYNYTFNTSSVNSPGGNYFMSLYQKSADGVRKKVANNGNNNTLPITVVGIPPYISTISLVAGAIQVPVEGQLIIVFDKPMNTTPGAGAVTFSGGVVGNEYKSWSPDDKVCTIPYSGLDYNTTYTYGVSGFKDASGNVMTAITGQSFTTGLPTSINDIVAAGVSVYGRGNTIYVSSGTADLIKTVEVYTMQGVLIYSNTNINASSHSFTVNNSSGKIYLVKVATDSGFQNIKLIGVNE